MPDFTLMDLTAVIRSYGRGVVYRAPVWDAASALVMEHAIDTEGDISIATNPEMAKLTLPELTGPAAHETDYTGEDPVIEIPGYLTDPATAASWSPTGTASAGRQRRTAPVEYTVAIFPEALLLTLVGGIPTPGTLAFSGGAWTLNGTPLTPAQLTLLDHVFWAWRCTANRPPRRYLGGAGDARKNIETVSIQLMHHPDMPNGHHLYTIGNPADYGIDLEFGILS